MNTKLFIAIVLLCFGLSAQGQLLPLTGLKSGTTENQLLITRDSFGAPRFVYKEILFDVENDSLRFTNDIRISVNDFGFQSSSIYNVDDTLTSSRTIEIGDNQFLRFNGKKDIFGNGTNVSTAEYYLSNDFGFYNFDGFDVFSEMRSFNGNLILRSHRSGSYGLNEIEVVGKDSLIEIIAQKYLKLSIDGDVGSTGKVLGSDGDGHVAWVNGGGSGGNSIKVDSISFDSTNNILTIYNSDNTEVNDTINLAQETFDSKRVLLTNEQGKKYTAPFISYDTISKNLVLDDSLTNSQISVGGHHAEIKMYNNDIEIIKHGGSTLGGISNIYDTNGAASRGAPRDIISSNVLLVQDIYKTGATNGGTHFAGALTVRSKVVNSGVVGLEKVYPHWRYTSGGINNQSAIMEVVGETGQLRLNNYPSGNITGAVIKGLGFDSDGWVVPFELSGGGLPDLPIGIDSSKLYLAGDGEWYYIKELIEESDGEVLIGKDRYAMVFEFQLTADATYQVAGVIPTNIKNIVIEGTIRANDIGYTYPLTFNTNVRTRIVNNTGEIEVYNNAGIPSQSNPNDVLIIATYNKI